MENRQLNLTATDTKIDQRELLLLVLRNQQVIREDISSSDKTIKEQIDKSSSGLVDELHIVEGQNQQLLDKLNRIEKQNIELKEELIKSSADKIAFKLSFSFFILFSISILLTVFYNYELVMFSWAKIGAFISLTLSIIALLIGNMWSNKKEEINETP